MIKILSAEQLQLADQSTINNEPISSIDLMERAAKSCNDWLLNFFPAGIDYIFFCGRGNNGGDGLALARLLFQKGKNIQVFILNFAGNPSADFTTNLDRLKKIAPFSIFEVDENFEFPKINSGIILIDALYGIGLNKPLSKSVMNWVKNINKSGNIIIAIDVPSGLFIDQPTENLEETIHANFTLTFQLPKRSFFYPEYAIATGIWEVLDIGLDKSFLEVADSKTFLLTEADIRELLRPKALFGHKGQFGHALILAGSYGKAGAAILAAKACLRSGAGLVTLRVAENLVNPIQTAIPEVMLIPDSEKNYLSTPIIPGNYTAIGIGPGIGIDKETGNVLKRLIQDVNLPMVFDADALNLLAENPTWLSFIPGGSILTPHIGEFKRLAGNYPNPFDRSNAQKEFAKKYNCYVLLKGKYSAIACPDGSLIFNPTGNPGMATAGSGDTLTGIITSFLAQGYSSFQAVILGVYIHGLAGDLAAETLSEHTMIASDIIDFLPGAFKTLTS